MAKGKLPEGYRGVDKIIKEFRKENPKGKIETSPVLLGDGYVIITAKVTKDDGAIGSGMADADVQDDKSVEKAESGAIRRALLTLGYESVEGADEGDDEEKEPAKEEKSEKRFSKRDDKKEDRRSESAKEADEDDDKEEKEEKPKSRFGNKNREEKSEKRSSRNEESDGSEDDDEEQEGESRFKRGSRFQRG